jgi:intracellular proteinase inhibitor BsuPI
MRPHGSPRFVQMSLRFFVPLLLAGALAFACSPRSHSSEPPHTARVMNGSSVASSLNVDVADHVKFTLHVTNRSEKRIELNFPNGQTHDIVVLDSLSREVWRWSEGRLFTQSLQNRVLGSNETASYEEQWSPKTAHGTYTAVATLRSTNYPVEQKVEFTLP